MRKTREERHKNRLQQQLERTLDFSKALAQHVAKGLPKATDEEIQRRFSICKTCPHFSGRSCRVCHCGVNTKQYLLNKLAWADQSCPDNPQRW